MSSPHNVDPLYEHRLRTVYAKLERLLPGGDNERLVMNSKGLKHDLAFTVADRETMHTQITTVHPSMTFRFIHPNNPQTFSFSHGMTGNVCALFKPTDT